jgi:hypothetical protein
MCKGEMSQRWVKNHEWKIHACGARWVDHLFEKQWKIIDEQKYVKNHGWKILKGERWVEDR